MTTEKPTVTGEGYHGGEIETHPAWAVARFNRFSGGQSRYFDSDIRHTNGIYLQIDRAERHRHLKMDWIHGKEQLIEIRMSEAQFGALVSSFGNGSGVPVTLTYVDRERMPDIDDVPRLEVSRREVGEAAAKGAETVRRAAAAMAAAVNAEKTSKKALREALRSLELAIDHLPADLEFAAKSLHEHTENIVTKARADVEAMVDARAAEFGVSRFELGLGDRMMELESGES